MAAIAHLGAGLAAERIATRHRNRSPTFAARNGAARLIQSRDRQKLKKKRPQAGEAGETARSTNANTRLVLVAQAVSPANRGFSCRFSESGPDPTLKSLKKRPQKPLAI